MKRNDEPTAAGCLVLLYAIASPVYVLRFCANAIQVFRLWRISRLGYVDCPHCGAENAIDVLSVCPRCKTSEYGSRLRCTSCGLRMSSFPCEACGVTIRCL